MICDYLLPNGESCTKVGKPVKRDDEKDVWEHLCFDHYQMRKKEYKSYLVRVVVEEFVYEDSANEACRFMCEQHSAGSAEVIRTEEITWHCEWDSRFERIRDALLRGDARYALELLEGL